MKNRIKLTRLGRTTSHRKSLVRNMVQSLIRHDHVETTLSKAKVLKQEADRLVSKMKRERSHEEAKKRYLKGYLTESAAIKRLNEVILPRFEHRVGGYTTLYRVRDRLGDGATMARVEWMPNDVTSTSSKAEPKVEATVEQTEAKPKAKPKAKKITKVKKATNGQDK